MPSLPTHSSGAVRYSKQKSLTALVSITGTSSLKSYGGEVEIDPRKLHSPTGWTFWMRTWKRETVRLVEGVEKVKPPQGEVGWVSSSKPRLGGCENGCLVWGKS